MSVNMFCELLKLTNFCQFCTYIIKMSVTVTNVYTVNFRMLFLTTKEIFVNGKLIFHWQWIFSESVIVH